MRIKKNKFALQINQIKNVKTKIKVKIHHKTYNRPRLHIKSNQTIQHKINHA